VAVANQDSLQLAEEDLSMITAAARARQNRQKNKNKKVVQKGGIVTVKGARAAIDARVEQEAAKAARAAARQYKIDAQNAADA
jgi:hypothetical protein